MSMPRRLVCGCSEARDRIPLESSRARARIGGPIMQQDLFASYLHTQVPTSHLRIPQSLLQYPSTCLSGGRHSSPVVPLSTRSRSGPGDPPARLRGALLLLRKGHKQHALRGRLKRQGSSCLPTSADVVAPTRCPPGCLPLPLSTCLFLLASFCLPLSTCLSRQHRGNHGHLRLCLHEETEHAQVVVPVALFPPGPGRLTRLANTASLSFIQSSPLHESPVNIPTSP